MITEELEKSLTRPRKVRLLKPVLSIPKWNPFFKEIRIGFALALIAFLYSSLGYFEKSMKNLAQVNLQEFEWLVMAQGDQVAVDEVGRFLRQLDGVHKVEFFSSEMLIRKMEQDGILAQDLALIKTSSLPPSWKVRWVGSAQFQTLLNETLSDIKNFPGVVDVAFNSDVLKDYQRAIAHGLQLQLCRSGVLFILLLAFLVMLGQLVFFTSLSKKQWLSLWLPALSALAFWSLGCLFFRGTVGSVDGGIWSLGLGAMAFRSLYQLLEPKDHK